MKKPAEFNAVILHELSHIKNRDIDQTYLTLAIWRAFVVAALLPLAIVLIFSRVLGEPQLLIWRIVVLALIVYSLRNAILRSREFDADARARQLDPGIALDAVFADLPARTGRCAWHLGWTHPSGQQRAAALADPAPLYRFGFWDGLSIGLVTALGATSAHEIVTLLSTTFGTHLRYPGDRFRGLRRTRARGRHVAAATAATGHRAWSKDGQPGWGWARSWRSARSSPRRAHTVRRSPRTIRAWRPSASSRCGSPSSPRSSRRCRCGSGTGPMPGSSAAIPWRRAFPPGAPWSPPLPPRGPSWPSAFICCWRMSPASSYQSNAAYVWHQAAAIRCGARPLSSASLLSRLSGVPAGRGHASGRDSGVPPVAARC